MCSACELLVGRGGKGSGGSGDGRGHRGSGAPVGLLPAWRGFWCSGGGIRFVHKWGNSVSICAVVVGRMKDLDVKTGSFIEICAQMRVGLKICAHAFVHTCQNYPQICAHLNRRRDLCTLFFPFWCQNLCTNFASTIFLCTKIVHNFHRIRAPMCAQFFCVPNLCTNKCAQIRDPQKWPFLAKYYRVSIGMRRHDSTI